MQMLLVASLDFININYSTLLSIWVSFVYVVWFCFTFYNFMMFLAIVHKDVWNITKYLYKKAKLKITQKVLKVAEAVSHLSSGSSSKEPVPTSFPRLSAAMGGRPPRKNDDDDKKKKKKEREEAKKQKAKEDAAAAANRIWWIKVGAVALVGVALVGVYVYNKDRINEVIFAILTGLSEGVGSKPSGEAGSGGAGSSAFIGPDNSAQTAQINNVPNSNNNSTAAADISSNLNSPSHADYLQMFEGLNINPVTEEKWDVMSIENREVEISIVQEERRKAVAKWEQVFLQVAAEKQSSEHNSVSNVDLSSNINAVREKSGEEILTGSDEALILKFSESTYNDYVILTAKIQSTPMSETAWNDLSQQVQTGLMVKAEKERQFEAMFSGFLDMADKDEEDV